MSAKFVPENFKNTKVMVCSYLIFIFHFSNFLVTILQISLVKKNHVIVEKNKKGYLITSRFLAKFHSTNYVQKLHSFSEWPQNCGAICFSWKFLMICQVRSMQNTIISWFYHLCKPMYKRLVNFSNKFYWLHLPPKRTKIFFDSWT